MTANSSLDLSVSTFYGWVSGADTYSVIGLIGNVTIAGSSQADRFVAPATMEDFARLGFGGWFCNDVFQH